MAESLPLRPCGNPGEGFRKGKDISRERLPGEKIGKSIYKDKDISRKRLPGGKIGKSIYKDMIGKSIGKYLLSTPRSPPNGGFC